MRIKFNTGGWKPYSLSNEELKRLREGLPMMERALREAFKAERQRNVMPAEYRNRIIN